MSVPEVRARIVGATGRITLDRQPALNALTTQMVLAIQEALLAWREDPRVRAVILDGAGERAFCAGGDIRILTESGAAGDGRAETFWREEYRLNQLIARYPKPYVALIDGIVMGGGMGLSVHGSFRVAGDRTLAAMPETGIGYITDVGGTYFLPRLPRRMGVYLGLTGARLKAADALAVGIATHYVASRKIPALLEALESADLDDDGGAVEATIAAFEGDPGPPPIAVRRADIERLFAGERVEDIVARLDAEESDWAREQAAALRLRSPTSLKRTLRALRENAALSLEDALERELAFSLGCLEPGSDFYEGVRALLVDKDNAPRWSPPTLEQVSDKSLDAFFAPKRKRRIDFLAPRSA